MAQDARQSFATPDEERAFRMVTDVLRSLVDNALPTTPIPNPAGVGSLWVSALMATAAGLIASFPEDLRGQALEHAQDYLSRSVDAQVAADLKQKGKSDGVHRGGPRATREN